MSSKLNEWEERNYHGQVVWFISPVDKRIGDGYGNEWMHGLSISVEDEQCSVFEDDGYGTGAHVCNLSTDIDEAKEWCENLLVGHD